MSVFSRLRVTRPRLRSGRAPFDAEPAIEALLGVVLLAATVLAQAAPSKGEMVHLRIPVGEAIQPAVLWVPAGEAPAEGWPMIVFLHGLGERGKDGEHLQVGLPRQIEQHPERFPCLVLMPQCPADRVWVKIGSKWSHGLKDAEKHIDAALDYVLAHQHVDEHRIALTGLSMGGFGTWVYGAEHVDRFCRLAPLCGGGHQEDAEALARRPLWVFHGSADPVVPVTESRKMVEAVREAGGTVRYTEYDGVGHDCWDRAYADARLIRWLLGHDDDPRLK